MSLLDQLKAKKSKLKPTDTLVRFPDGSRVLESDGQVIPQPCNQFGFVVDTKPDNCPAVILDKKLYLGSQDCVDPEVLTKFEITDILSVGIPTPEFGLAEVKSQFISCLDLPETNIVEDVFETAFKCLDSCFDDAASNRRVLVHCNAGVSRSSSVVIGYLIKRMGYSFDDAFKLVKSKRECIQPNAGFIRQLKKL